MISQYEDSSCTNGHEWSEKNTYFRPDGQKICKSCRREAVERYRIAAKEALRAQRMIEHAVMLEAQRNAGVTGTVTGIQNKMLEKTGGKLPPTTGRE